MEIAAALAQLELSASDPQAMAQFYAATFKLEVAPQGAGWACVAPGRSLVLVPGEGGQLRRVTFRFHEQAGFAAHRAALGARGVALAEDHAGTYTVLDPAGHRVTFAAPDPGQRMHAAADARLQHFALRSPRPAALAAFYVEQLGFVVSDRVFDEAGDLTAIFLRTDSEHHAFAIFRAPLERFDHFSCEAADWGQLRDWADHMASVGVDLAWGIGRHGPGNDTFLMVRDIDGNMGEISAELEICQPDRPAGVWPHRPQTLNRWGVAIMRS